MLKISSCLGLLLCLTLSVSTGGAETEYPLTPDSKPQPGVAKGDILKFTFESSKIFPGTSREVSVYVPRQYDPATPACVYVGQDGGGFNATTVFDNLIERKEIPVLIGVFIRPGVVLSGNTNALDRFNRSLEYDGLGPDYVEFLLKEIFPAVEKLKTTDGRAIHVSTNGNDRCIGGASSGAICAFTAAWERPDAFSRVFSSIGTFVGLRGGNEYPTLVRKFEPRAIRVFQEDGTNDLNIYGGDWWMANQELERSLEFSGYQHDHQWGNNGHATEHASAIFPDGMRFLWKDWPEPVQTGATKNPFLRDILIPGETWQAVQELRSMKISSNSFHGIRANDRVTLHNGFTYVTESGSKGDKAGRVWFVSASGRKQVVDGELKFPNGVTVSPDQSLLYVDDATTHWVCSYRILSDGSLEHKQRYFRLHVPDTAEDSGAAGMQCDRDGRLYVATRMGVQVCDQAGRVNCILNIPKGAISRLNFDPLNNDILCCTIGGETFKRRLKVKGALPSEAPLKPAAPRL